jgi:Holliday junction DNA helicase RuvA
MIGRLIGVVVTDELDGALIVDVGGVGYEVMAPIGTVGRAKTAGADGRVTLYVHTHVREDALDLYGFASLGERQTFRLLLGVPNVGPKTALGVLSALPALDLVRAVEARDVARLNKISGIGRKTAERLILELREKLPQVGLLDESGPPVAATMGDAERLLGALTNMGYRPAEAQKAVAALGPRVGKDAIGTLLKEALAELAR